MDIQEYQKSISELSQDYAGIGHSSPLNSLINTKAWSAPGRSFLNTSTNVSVKSDYSRQDYDYYRGGETIPTDPYQIMELSNKAYETNGIVYNILNIMTDFSVYGIDVVHEIPAVNRFFKKWWKHVNGYEVSERILNYAIRMGNTVVKRTYANVPMKIQQKWKAKAEAIRIPFKYTCLNPTCVKVLGGELAQFVGKKVYAIQFSPNLNSNYSEYQRILTDKQNNQFDLNDIPDDIYQALLKGQKQFILDNDKIEVLHYKKNDWDVWAKPLTYPILSNLMMLEKFHLADSSALDGAISNIRLWKLGILGPTPETSILPTRAAIIALRNILSNNVTGGVMDLIWGPELDFKESNTQVHNFLGQEKYKQCMSEIYEGLGIPASLTGGSSSSGFTNNFISLKTLIERLRYLRNMLRKFWEKEIRLVQEAMGFTKPAHLVFDDTMLSDEAAEKSLLIQLLDRNIISAEAVRERFHFLNDIENSRITRETKKISKKKMPNKAGPFHNPQLENELKKIALQAGAVTPSEVGLELEARKSGEVPALDKKPLTKYDPPGPNGRPKNKKDSQKRKQRRVLPRSKADFGSVSAWADGAQEKISEIMIPVLLEVYSKKNVRSFTKAQKEETEQIKFQILCNLNPFTDITMETVYSIMDKPIVAEFITAKSAQLDEFFLRNEKQPTVDELRKIQSLAYAAVVCNDKTEEILE